jgi:hypothetical protein
VQGPAGPGIAAGGTAGDVLVKRSATDYDTAWSSALPVAWRQTVGTSGGMIRRDPDSDNTGTTGFGVSYETTVTSPAVGDLTGRSLLITVGDANTNYYTGFLVNVKGNGTYNSAAKTTSWQILLKRVDGVYTDSGWGSTTVYVNCAAL